MNPRGARTEGGYTLVELLIALVLLALVITAVDASVTMLNGRQVQVSDAAQALDGLQLAQQAVTRTIRAATAWTAPAVPTQPPGQPVTATTLQFTAALNNATATVSIVIDETAHTLTVTSTVGSASQVLAQVGNVDPSSLFTMTTREVSTTVNSVTTNAFFFTSVSSALTVDSPRVGAPNVFPTTVTTPAIVAYNLEYACQAALARTGASGSC